MSKHHPLWEENKHLNEYLVLIQISEYLALLWVHAVKHLQAAYELGADRKFFHLVFMKIWYCITDERGRLETSLSYARFDWHNKAEGI